MPKPTGKAEISVSHTAYWSVVNSWAKRINKPELTKLMKPMRELFKGLKINYVPEGVPSLIPGYVKKLVDTDVNAMKKEQLEELATDIGSNLPAIKAIAEGADPRYLKAWRQLASHVCVKMDEMTRILGHRPPTVSPASWSFHSDYLSEPMLMLAGVYVPTVWKNYYREPDFDNAEFYIPQIVRVDAIQLFFPPGATNLIANKELPKGEFRIENDEAEMYREISLLAAIGSSGKINTTTDSITQQKIKSLTTKVMFAPFKVGEENSYPLVREEIVSVCYLLYYASLTPGTRLTDAADLGVFAKFLLSDRFFRKLSGTIFKYFLPKLDGFKKSWAGANYAPQLLRKLRDLIAPSNGSWLDMANFELRWLCNDNILSRNHAYTPLIPSEHNSREKVFRKKDILVEVYDYVQLDWWKELTLEFILNYLRTLAAVGIIEIAYGEKGVDDEDLLKGIRFIRLTPLGMYAFGKAPRYEPAFEVEKSEINYDFDPLNPILTIYGGESPYVPFLNDIGERISPTRFKITAQTIVSKSSSAEEVLNRLGVFKNLVCPNPEGIWAEMIEEAKRRANVAVHNSENYSVMTLDLSVAGLAEFINSNDEILSNCLRAEGSILLVPSSFRLRFRELLHDAGYIE